MGIGNYPCRRWFALPGQRRIQSAQSHLKEKVPFPLSYWEGPDGSRVLLRWDGYEDTHKWGGYSEAYVFWRSKSDAERIDYIEKTTACYEAIVSPAADDPVSRYRL